jgi:hypothetical protein
MGSDANVVWRQAAAGMEYDIRTGNGIIRFTEADLTTVIDESLSVAAADLPLSVKNPQIAVLPDSMEFAFTTPRGDRNVPVIVQMSPHVKGGLLTLEVLGITVGGTKLPGFLTDMAAKMINKVFVQDFSSNLPDGVLLRKVETTRDGHLNLTIGLSG